MRKQFRIFKVLFKIGFLKLSKYVEASLVNLMSALIFICVQFFVWKEVMQNSADTSKYTFYQMFSYIVFSQIIFHLYPNMLGSQLSGMIRTGDISFSLTKPLPILQQLIYENIGVSAYRFLFVSLPILIMGCVISGFQLSIVNPLTAIISAVMSYMIFALLDMIFGMLQFYTSSSWGINSLKYAIITLLSGQMLPLNIYPNWCQKLINYLPFRHLYDTPLQILIGQKRDRINEIILIEIAWILILYLIFRIGFKYAEKSIIVQGG